MPTIRQYTVLQTLWARKMTAKQICVRSDVLWRMEERGWVARSCYPSGDVWYILQAGEAVPSLTGVQRVRNASTASMDAKSFGLPRSGVSR